MKQKSAKVIIICLVAAIIMAVSAITTVLVVRKTQNRKISNTESSVLFSQSEAADQPWTEEQAESDTESAESKTEAIPVVKDTADTTVPLSTAAALPAATQTTAATTTSAHAGTTQKTEKTTVQLVTVGTTRPVSAKRVSTVQVLPGEGVQSVSGNGQFTEGAQVSVSAVLKQGYEFSGWMENESPVSNKKTYSFLMPDHAVTLTAVAKPQFYTVTVQTGAGIADVSGSGQYKIGDMVSISATAQPNYTFNNWSGFAVGNPASANTTFPMPGQDVVLTATATEDTKFVLSVEKGDNGITSVSGGGSFYAGKDVTVTCQVAAGFVLDGWYSSDMDLLPGSTNQSYTFKMPNDNVTLTAKATSNQYTVTVSSGTGISAVSGGGKYIVGTNVTVNCQVKDGYLFSGWSSSSSLVKSGATQSYSFVMPKSNVTLTAKAVNNTYTLTLNKGDGIEAVSGGGKYTAGSSVTASCVPKTGYVFTEWTSSTSQVGKSTIQSYAFAMPKTNVTLTAKAKKNIYTVSISKGSGISSVGGAGKYAVGDIVTVYATPVNGYAFDRWVQGGSTKSYEQTYSFTMPDKDVSLSTKAVRIIN